MADETPPASPQNPSPSNFNWNVPPAVVAAGVAIALAPPVGAVVGTLTLTGLGLKSLQDDVKSCTPAPTKEPALQSTTNPMGDMYEYSDDAGCVEVHSRLPGQIIAGEVAIGSALQLADEKTMESAAGVVSFSERKPAEGYRITAEGGATLVCSDTAPIPTPEGLVLSTNLAGKKVAVRIEEPGLIRTEWRTVTSVEYVGKIEVQHITVGNKCFWAGEKAGAYILHHNMKAALIGGPVYNDWW